MNSPFSRQRLYTHTYRDGKCLRREKSYTTLPHEIRLYSRHRYTDGSYAGASHMTDAEALQYNINQQDRLVAGMTTAIDFAVPFMPNEQIDLATSNYQVRRYTFRYFKHGGLTAGEAWMTDEDALNFNLHSKGVVYAVPWAPPEQLPAQSLQLVNELLSIDSRYPAGLSC